MITLKELRVKYGITQKTIAKDLGISCSVYGMKERVITPFTDNEKKIIADIFDLKVKDIDFEPKRRLTDIIVNSIGGRLTTLGQFK